MLMKVLVILVIIALAFWKFYVYYNLLRNGIFILAVGRLTLSSIILGLLVHIFVTKIVFVDLLRLSRRRYEKNQFDNGNGAFIAHHENEGILIQTSNLNTKVDF